MRSILTYLSISVFLVCYISGLRVYGQIDALGTTPEAQQKAIDALRGIPSNLQKNRDGTVRFVRFSKPHVRDEHLQHLKAFSQLDYLAVVTPEITDEGIANIQTLANLDTLILTNTQVTDVTGRLLKKLPKLKTLYLDGTKITDVTAPTIGTLNSLEHLSLSSTSITPTALESLKNLPELKTLFLQHCSLNDDIFPILAQFPALQSIYLDHTDITGQNLGNLSTSTTIRTLSFAHTPFSPDALSDFNPSDSLTDVILWKTSVTAATIPEDVPPSLRSLLKLSPTNDNSLSPFQKYTQGLPLRTIPQQKQRVPTSQTMILDAPTRFEDIGSETPDFQRHVIPLLGKLGCNGRACHGSFQGQGGFALSMFGYDFQNDHRALLAEGETRVVPNDPDSSLAILKPSGHVDHEGGLLLEEDTWQFNLLYSWINSGAKTNANPHELYKVEVEPAEVLFHDPMAPITISVKAFWLDGTVEDVSALARYSIIDSSVAKMKNGNSLVSLAPGDTHVIVSYDKAVVSVPVLRPLPATNELKVDPTKGNLPVDRHINNKLRKLGIVPSPNCTDTEFLRRVTLDLTGTLPSIPQIREFVQSTSTTKRSDLIEELLETPAYADWWAMRITDLTGCNSQHLGSTDMNSPAAGQWQRWIRERVYDNVPWDHIAAGIVLADSREPGQPYDEYALEQSHYHTPDGDTAWSAHDNSMHYYWARSDLNTAENKALNFSYAFMGVRLQCAQCHKHPFDQWSKQEFDQFTTLFERVKWGVNPDTKDTRDALLNRLGVPHKLDTAALRRQMYNRVSAEGKPIPWFELRIDAPSNETAIANVLGSKPFDANQFSDPREPLFAWLVSEDNPYFATAFVNRVWAQYFGTGIINPIDDLSAGNPPNNRELIEYLARGFRENGFDMKWLHKEITNSQAYQRSSKTNQTNQNDGKHFSHSRIRRLPAETLIDAMEMATAKSVENHTFLTNTKDRNIRVHPRSLSPNTTKYSLIVFGKPTRATNCDCERTDNPTLLQNLYVKNDREVLEMIERKTGWLAEVAQRSGLELISETGQGVQIAAKPTIQARVKLSTADLVQEAYLRTLSRDPTTKELQFAVEHVNECESVIEGLRDLLWALINTQEFITNH